MLPSDENGSATAQPAPLALVGIGASAGGLAALKSFFEAVPKDSGLAFVVVVHIAAEGESMLADVLQNHVGMPVRQVVETLAVQPNQVYVIPPGYNLEAVDTHLRLSSLELSRRARAPIDHFFRTLAKTHDGDSVGVILSGTGSDGTLGIKEIKQVGGLTVAQDPNEAEYDGMPWSAISTGFVDLVLPVADIPGAILRYIQTRTSLPVPPEDEDVDGDQRQLLGKLLAQVRVRTGRDFSRYKRSTVMRRIQRRMQLHQIEHFEDYLRHMRAQPEEAQALADEFLVTVTNFFRDPEVFSALEHDVIPHLFDHKDPEDNIRIWTVGCATGEEVYSVAMLLMEEASRREQFPQLQLFASDLHQRSLEFAREGLYPENIEADVSLDRLRRFFTKESGGYRVRRELRDLVVFAPHNLLSDPPFSKVDLISCRNLLIYLQRDVQRDVIELFHYALCPDGFLVLGTSETAGRMDLFRVEDKKYCFYRKRNVPTRDPRLPVFAPMQLGVPGRLPHRQPITQPPPSYASLHTQLIVRHASPSVLLNQDHDIVHLSPGVGRYMQVPGGEPTANVFKLLRDELRLEVRAALHTAEKEHRPSRAEPVVLELEGQPRCVTVAIWPSNEEHNEGLALLVFEEREVKERALDQATTEHGDSEGARELREELEQTRHRLQGLIERYETSQEEMKAANEELQSANEELRSTMEELETSKEELQSMNEELSTLNQENRHKVDELSELSSDLENLMSATDIATLFLDRDLRILRFTPRVGELFNIRGTDRGRPLTDLTHRLVYDALASDAREVLDRLAPIEREVMDQGGGWYVVRVHPYRAAHHRIGGVVITLVEISERRKAERTLLERAEVDVFRLKLTDAIRPLVDPVAIERTAAQLLGEYLDANRVFYVELTRGPQVGEVRAAHRRNVADVVGEYRLADHGDTLVNELRTGRAVIVSNVFEDHRLGASERAAAHQRNVAAFVTVPVVKAAKALGVFVIQQSEPRQWEATEVLLMEETCERMWMAAERVRATNSLRQSEERYRTLFESINEGFCIVEVLFDDAGAAVDYRYVEINPAFKAQTGIQEAVGRTMRELAPEHEEYWYEAYGRVAKTGEPMRFEAQAHSLGRFYLVNAFRVGAREQRRVAILFKDITERKQLEDQLSESNRRKDEFLATLAHELRNPLAPITNALAMLHFPVKPERADELHALIERQVRHMVRLVEDLLDVSRITRGLIELRKETVDLEQIIQTAIETSRPHLQRGQRQLEVETPGEPVFVEGDSTRLAQIVANLLNNAAKFTREGGHIWLTLERIDGRARLSVRDDGVGISQAMLRKVFDMFTQVEPSRADGLGIGLTLVKSLVELHGGNIEARSEGPGHGSEFIIALPLSSATPRIEPEAPIDGKRRKIERSCPVLIVDDNKDAADSLGLLLADMGLEVKVAHDGPKALELCRDWAPKLVFLDLQLPDMDGFEIARALRKAPGGEAMEIVALTGAGHEKDRERAQAAGFDRHLLKPIQLETLEELLVRHCR